MTSVLTVSVFDSEECPEVGKMLESIASWSSAAARHAHPSNASPPPPVVAMHNNANRCDWEAHTSHYASVALLAELVQMRLKDIIEMAEDGALDLFTAAEMTR